MGKFSELVLLKQAIKDAEQAFFEACETMGVDPRNVPPYDTESELDDEE